LLKKVKSTLFLLSAEFKELLALNLSLSLVLVQQKTFNLTFDA